MSYFAILWKTPQLSLEELHLIWPINLHQKGKIVIFDLDDMKSDEEDGVRWRRWDFHEQMKNLAGIIKWGRCVHVWSDEFEEEVQWLAIAGVSERKLWMILKKKYGVRRFKEIAWEKSDLEIKEQGKEFIDLDEFAEGMIGIVNEWQDIKRFEVIDFEKPARGMNIGMMPGKLTQILVNMGVTCVPSPPASLPTTSLGEGGITVYDPFCGFGTTGFVANSLGYHFIGSDINITPAKQNKKWRLSTQYHQDGIHFTLFKHDVNNAFTKSFLKQVDVMVTEGWLGPVVKSYNPKNKGQMQMLLKNVEEIVAVYRAFLKNTKGSLPQVPIVMTVPVYHWLGDVIEKRISDFARDIGYEVSTLGEIYQRKNQLVGRRVLKVY